MSQQHRWAFQSLDYGNELKRTYLAMVRFLKFNNRFMVVMLFVPTGYTPWLIFTKQDSMFMPSFAEIFKDYAYCLGIFIVNTIRLIVTALWLSWSFRAVLYLRFDAETLYFIQSEKSGNPNKMDGEIE